MQDNADLTGYTIERAHESVPTDVYYEFGDDSNYVAGTVIRIHSKSPEPGIEPNPERKDIYIGSTADILSNAGEMLQITDKEGNKIHCRQFTSEPFSSISDKVIASNKDGTRSFVFIKDSTGDWIQDIEDGLYRIEWTFRRDPGDGSKLPVLWRCGSTSEERTIVEFNVPPSLP